MPATSPRYVPHSPPVSQLAGGVVTADRAVEVVAWAILGVSVVLLIT